MVMHTEESIYLRNYLFKYVILKIKIERFWAKFPISPQKILLPPAWSLVFLIICLQIEGLFVPISDLFVLSSSAKFSKNT